MALPPRAPAAALESSEAKVASSIAARDLNLIAVSVSGSTSGTSSTTYTSSRGSVLSSGLGHISELQCIDDEEKAKRLERARHLAKEFFHRDGDIGVLQRWLSEMGVGWVLHLADDPSAGTSLLRAHCNLVLAERWIQALTEITEPTHLDYIVWGTDAPVGNFRIFEATVLKMLPFVDALLAAVDLDTNTDDAGGASNGAQAAPSEKLQVLLGVHHALSRASEGIQLCSLSDSLEEIEAQGSKLLSLVSEKDHELEEAIENTIEGVRTGILNSDDDDNDWGNQTSQGSPNICKITRSLITCIKFLWGDYWRLNDPVHASAMLRHLTKLASLASEMVSSLEVKLAKRSKSFPDHSLRFLFLINNTHFIQQQLFPLIHMKYYIAYLTPKIEDYLKKYLQASWAPVMSCLYNHTPCWFRKNSTLPKFNSKFQKTYTVHKHWKVPDPELRTRLRKAIIEQVVPVLTRYLEDDNVNQPRSHSPGAGGDVARAVRRMNKCNICDNMLP